MEARAFMKFKTSGRHLTPKYRAKYVTSPARGAVHSRRQLYIIIKNTKNHPDTKCTLSTPLHTHTHTQHTQHTRVNTHTVINDSVQTTFCFFWLNSNASGTTGINGVGSLLSRWLNQRTTGISYIVFPLPGDLGRRGSWSSTRKGKRNFKKDNCRR